MAAGRIVAEQIGHNAKVELIMGANHAHDGFPVRRGKCTLITNRKKIGLEGSGRKETFRLEEERA